MIDVFCSSKAGGSSWGHLLTRLRYTATKLQQTCEAATMQCLLKMKVHLIQAQTFERVVPNWKKSPMCKFFFCMISIKMLWNDSEFFDVTLA